MKCVFVIPIFACTLGTVLGAEESDCGQGLLGKFRDNAHCVLTIIPQSISRKAEPCCPWSGSGSKKKRPQRNIRDPRFRAWSPASVNDSRSSCPGLNSFANHGFLPHNGKNIDASDITTACWQAFGLSPVICTIITLNGLINAKLPLNAHFALSDVDRSSWQIVHDSSFSRQDMALGDSVSFDQGTWDLTVRELEKCGPKVDLKCWGRARVAQMNSERRRNPSTVYDDATAAHIAVEVARVTLALGDKSGVKLKYLRDLFEHERLPIRRGWRPKANSGTVQDVLYLASRGQRTNRQLSRTGDGEVSTRADIINILSSQNPHFLSDVQGLVERAGFPRRSFKREMDELRQEKEETLGPDDDF